MIWICTRGANASRVLPVFIRVFLIFGGVPERQEIQQNLNKISQRIRIMYKIHGEIGAFPPTRNGLSRSLWGLKTA